MKKAVKILLIIVIVLVLVFVGTFAFNFIKYKYFRRSYEGEVISFNALDKINENSENFDPANYGLTLAWSDDFDGDKLDPKKWECCPEWERGDVGARWDDDMVELDGKGKSEIDTGCGFLDHMLTLFASHGRFDLKVKCVGDTNVDYHHTVEDIGIVLGDALKDALDRKSVEDCKAAMENLQKIWMEVGQHIYSQANDNGGDQPDFTQDLNDFMNGQQSVNRNDIKMDL